MDALLLLGSWLGDRLPRVSCRVRPKVVPIQGRIPQTLPVSCGRSVCPSVRPSAGLSVYLFARACVCCHGMRALAACSSPSISCTRDLKANTISCATKVRNSSTSPEAEQGLVACGSSAARGDLCKPAQGRPSVCTCGCGSGFVLAQQCMPLKFSSPFPSTLLQVLQDFSLTSVGPKASMKVHHMTQTVPYSFKKQDARLSHMLSDKHKRLRKQ